MHRTLSLFVAAAFVVSALRLDAQTTSITFDALPRKSRTDSVTPRRAEKPVAKRPDSTATLRAITVAQRDSIERLARALEAAQARVDTVLVERVVADSAPPAGASVPTATGAATVPLPSAPTAAEPAATTPAATKPAATKTAAVVLGPTTVTGMLQILASGGDSTYRATYRIRRAELKLVSDLGHGASATVMIDVSKALALNTSGATPAVSQSSRVIQDAFIRVPVGRVDIEAGQQRLPLGLEGSHSSSILETVERSLMTSDRARGASFGDVRDLGVMAKGKVRTVEFRAGLFNGSGEAMNETDRNVGKAAAASLVWRPSWYKGLRFGLSGATSGAATGDKPVRDRVGADLQWQRGRALLQAEAMTGTDGTITRAGMYALTAWSLKPSLKLTARFDAWDPDRALEAAAANVTERDYQAGFTWAPRGTRLRLQSAVVQKTYTQSITPSATLLHAQLQASW